MLSFDGVGAYDTISRKVQMREADMVDGDKLIPFVRQFYYSPSTFLWEDEVGDARKINRVKEENKAIALVQVQADLRGGERLFACLDDFFVVCQPERVGAIYESLELALRTKVGIGIHLVKAK